MNALVSIAFVTVGHQAYGASLLDNGDGTVRDFDTGLVWQQRDVDNAQLNWADAHAYCNDLTLAGNSHWRLPKRKELVSIIDYRVDMPAIDDNKFPATNSDSYWSASSDVRRDTYAWHANFNGGHVNSANKINAHYVRCVR
ncbi:MAG: DUF1566 domain-containing protein [Arenicellales bacterium]